MFVALAVLAVRSPPYTSWASATTHQNSDDSSNNFTYAAGNPINYTDPSGAHPSTYCEHGISGYLYLTIFRGHYWNARGAHVHVYQHWSWAGETHSLWNPSTHQEIRICPDPATGTYLV